MSIAWFNGPAVWGLPVVPVLAAHLAFGLGLGAFYFTGLWWNARLFAEGTPLAAAIGLVIGRFALLAVFLTLASLEGALPLLLMALGVLAARPLVLRLVRTSAR